MELLHKQRQCQTQKLHLTPQMRQALDILNMPLSDLRSFIEEQIQQNPMLELEGGMEGSMETAESVITSPSDEDSYDSSQTNDAWDDVPARSTVATQNWGDSCFTEFCDDRGVQSTEINFFVSLKEQVGSLRLDKATQHLCNHIIDCLDSRGYLELGLNDIASKLHVPLFDVLHAINVIQSLTPKGVGARTLQECLMLQLKSSNSFCDETIILINQGLRLLAMNDMKGIAALLHCSVSKAIDYADIIRSFTPIPSRGFNTGETTLQLIPDAIITLENGGFSVDFCKQYLPKLQLSTDYNNLMDITNDPEVLKYLKAQKSCAQSLILAIDQRFNTLQKIILSIIDLQSAFFIKGIDLKPMALADIAERLSLHISTVSRAIQEKYIVCPFGTYKLKDFFTTGIQSDEGTAISNTLVRAKILDLIDSENPECPLSDESIRQALEAYNILISRRTVAKYRENAGIGNAKQRCRRIS